MTKRTVTTHDDEKILADLLLLLLMMETVVRQMLNLNVFQCYYERQSNVMMNDGGKLKRHMTVADDFH